MSTIKKITDLKDIITENYDDEKLYAYLVKEFSGWEGTS